MNRRKTPERSHAAPAGSVHEVDGCFDSACLLRALEAFAIHEARITERFYEIFFERRPDTLELFGVHSIAEREEMMRETLRSLHALHEGHAWLQGNLAALGTSHWEYGVTRDMYPSFVDSLIDAGLEILGNQIDESTLDSLRAATTLIAEQMSVAGEAASARHARKSSTRT